ncbi:MAG TPA: PhoU domain-containing protein [Ktedonobacterales bacterium]|nr:PhoU domain-containing protein [Ktedonobacterales bacterium]
MTNDPFHQELHKTRRIVIIQAVLVGKAITNAVHDLSQGSSTLAREVIAREGDLTASQRAIQRCCLDLFALQTTIARDLRELVVLERVASELEQMNQRSVRIAQQAVRLKYRGQFAMTRTLDVLTYLVCEQVQEGIWAFAERNLERARGLPGRQVAIVAQCRQTSQELLERMTRDASSVAAASGLLLATNELEGIGEHIIRIGEQVIALASGKIAIRT